MSANCCNSRQTITIGDDMSECNAICGRKPPTIHDTDKKRKSPFVQKSTDCFTIYIFWILNFMSRDFDEKIARYYRLGGLKVNFVRC